MNNYQINRVLNGILNIILYKYKKKPIVYSLGFYLMDKGYSIISPFPGILELINYFFTAFGFEKMDLSSYEKTNYLIGIGLLVVGFLLVYLEAKNMLKWKRKVYVVKHSSMMKLDFPTKKEIAKNFRINGEVEIDLRDKVGTMIEAIKEQEKRVRDIEKVESHNGLAYLGVAHLPLVFRLGYLLGDEKRYYYFENRKTTNEGFKELLPYVFYPRFNRNITEPKGNYTEVAITIGITFPVMRHEIPLDLNKIGLIEFEIDGLKEKGEYHDAIIGYNQLNSYKESIRKEISKIIKKQNIERIHIFYAGPTSLALAIGAMISPTHDPGKVINYHYVYSNDVKYPWGIDMKSGEVIKLS